MFFRAMFWFLSLGMFAQAGVSIDPVTGYTIHTPSSDSRIIYVSSSMGDDSNTGLSESSPKRSLAAGFALLRNGYPDHLLLKRGDTWNERFPYWNIGGRSPTERMLIGSYWPTSLPAPSVHQRPRILPPQPPALDMKIYGISRKSVAVTDLHITGNAEAPGVSDGGTAIEIRNGWTDVLFENLFLEKFRGGMDISTVGPGNEMKDIVVRKNIFYRNVFSGDTTIGGPGVRGVGLIAGTQNEGGRSPIRRLTVEKNLFDSNGTWKNDRLKGHPESHNVYLNGYENEPNYDWTVKENIFAYADGGKMLSYNLKVTDNLFLRTSIGILSCCQPGNGTVQTEIKRNVQLDSQDYCNNVPYGPNHKIGSFIYGEPSDTIIEENIIAHLKGSTGNINALVFDPSNNLKVLRNIVYAWKPQGVFERDANGLYFYGSHTNAQVTDNKVVFPDGGIAQYLDTLSFPGSGNIQSGNRYSSPTTNPFFHLGLGNLNFTQWRNLIDSTAQNTVSFPDPDRQISRYVAERIGGGSSLQSLDGFLIIARAESRWSHNPLVQASLVNNWVRDGFGMGSATPALPTVSLSTIDRQAREAGLDPGRIRVTRTGGDLQTSLSVTLNFDAATASNGIATAGSDYQIVPPHVIIPPQSSFVDVEIVPVDDSIEEGTEHIRLSLSPTSNYLIAPGAAQGTLAIGDNDELCPADFDRRGGLTANDFSVFQRTYSSQHPRADLDVSGTFTANDFTAMLQLYTQGCSQ